MNLIYANIDESKADLGLRHTYIPEVEWNIECDDNDRVSVECEYFRPAERTKYTTFSKEGSGGIDIDKIFRDKVKKINNLQINGKEIDTADKLLKYPSSIEIDALVNDVVLHLMNTESLNKEEVKN